MKKQTFNSIPEVQGKDAVKVRSKVQEGRPPPSRSAFKRKSKGGMKSRRLAAGIAKEGEQENKEYYQNIV